MGVPTTRISAVRVEDKNDLGFGAVVGADSKQRLLNKDGSFNVRRRGLRWFESHSPYHVAIKPTWPRFLLGTAAIRFSSSMVIAPFKGGRGLMLRLANMRDNQIIDLTARVNCSWLEEGMAGLGRKYRLLDLERSEVMLFPLAWTLVHPITEESPLYGFSDQDLRDAEFEFLVLVSGIDETFSQQVNARSSYKPAEIVWGAKFRNIFNPPDARGQLSVDIHRIDETDPFTLPV